MEWVVNATPQPHYPRERDPIPIVQEAGWAPGPVWTGAENLAPHRDSIPGPPSPWRVAIPTELSQPHISFRGLSLFCCAVVNISFKFCGSDFMREKSVILCMNRFEALPQNCEKLRHVGLSVRQSTFNNSAPTGRI